jgi:BlaI family penicillinase repressor
MSRLSFDNLSRRERQIMDVLFQLGEGGVEEVRTRLPEAPTYSTVRALLGKLERKGFVRHAERELRYVYRPAISPSEARRSALRRLVKVFYEGSVAQAATGLLESSVDKIPQEELERLAELIEKARSSRSRGGRQ